MVADFKIRPESLWFPGDQGIDEGDGSLFRYRLAVGIVRPLIHVYRIGVIQLRDEGNAEGKCQDPKKNHGGRRPPALNPRCMEGGSRG